ncbi:MAG: hypothetical protein HOJ57_28580 [Lentisphaerae bacterium]|jgi:hypothetical protein|nr:hypothetical protein [Lentisphaerota bacterium]MBT5609929.1 hypothetical protein [Lentisphaerota bacterium]
MKLTQKDIEFLEKLHGLLQLKGLRIEKRPGRPSYFVLRGNYGERIDRCFDMTRQGVRWRFHHVFTNIYVAAYETIFVIERRFGTSLRNEAMAISRERVLLRRRFMGGQMGEETSRPDDKNED